MTRVACLMATGLALVGCGFQPLYGSSAGDPGAAASLALVNVALIPNREGQELRQALQDRLERSGAGSSRYDLYVSLAVAGSGIAIDQQSASTRTRLSGTASWTLKAQDAGRTTLASGAGHSLDGYNIINQQFFAADLSQEAAIRRIDDALADQITQQLAIYFRQHPAS